MQSRIGMSINGRFRSQIHPAVGRDWQVLLPAVCLPPFRKEQRTRKDGPSAGQTAFLNVLG